VLRIWLVIWGLWLGMQTVLAETLDIGIFQRFGENADQAVIQAVDGAQLTVRLAEGQTITLRQFNLQTQRLPLDQPVPWSRVVVSGHRSYEDAQAVAQSLSLPTVVARPQRWQVWALAQDTAPTPEQERLVSELKGRGYPSRLDSGLRTDRPILSLTSSQKTYQTTDFTVEAPNQRIKFGKRVYGGTLRLSPNRYGTYTVINQVDLETYLRGVVPYEIAPKAPYEAIRAQAIVARTFALRNRNRFKVDGYDLCATANCQVYRGLGGVTDLTDRAVASTRGQVLSYRGELVDALYTSANGGQTARYGDLWTGADRPYLITKPDRVDSPAPTTLYAEDQVRKLLAQRQGFNESGTPAFRWVRTYSVQQLVASLAKNLPTLGLDLPDLTSVTGLRVLDRAPSGRVLRLEFQTNRGTFALSKDAILSAIDQLPSTLFYLEATADGFRLVGGGWGHGVGLSQYGSYGLAQRGWDCQRILQFYFPNTVLSKL